MKSLKFKFVVAVLTFVIGITAFFIWYSFKVSSETVQTELVSSPQAVQTELISSQRSNRISLHISSQKTNVKVGEQISLKVVVSNNDSDAVTLVSPGDGSEHAWRTPIVEWSIIKNNTKAKHPSEPTPSKEGRCGLMNSLKSEEVFSLAPGESRELNNSTFVAPFEKPGIYRVAFLYANRPSLQWRNEFSSQHNTVELEKVKNSTETTIVSNEIIFTVSD